MVNEHASKRRLPLLVPLLALVAACGSLDAAVSEHVESTEQPLLMVPGRLFPSSDIEVCWMSAASDPGSTSLGDAQEAANQAFVRKTVKAAIEPRTRLRFNGWGTCPKDDGTTRMKLYIRDGGFYGDPNSGTVIVDLNFDRPAPATNELTEQDVIDTYPHEFVHALGFDHEQMRVDSLCNKDNGGHHQGNDVPIGPPDTVSIMSYCPHGPALSRYDEFSLKLAYAAPGRFVRRENGAVYRLTNGDATKCRVVSDTQLRAFGASPAIQNSTLLTGPGLVTSPLLSDTWSTQGIPDCIWPDDFYEWKGDEYLTIGGDGIDGATPTVCRLDGAQRKIYHSDAFTFPIQDSVPLKSGRQDLGTCPWPDGFYDVPGAGMFRRENDVVCSITSSAMAIAMGAQSWVDVSSGSTAIRSADGAPPLPCAWPTGLYRSTASAGRWSSIYWYRADLNAFCEMTATDQPKFWNTVDWHFKYDPIAAVDDAKAIGGPLYGATDRGACFWPDGYYSAPGDTRTHYVHGSDVYGFTPGWQCAASGPVPSGITVQSIPSHLGWVRLHGDEGVVL